MTGQPSLVPLVEALVLIGCHSVLGLRRESRSRQQRTQTYFNKQQFEQKWPRLSNTDAIKPETNLSGLDQGSSAVHVIFGVHDENHLVSVELEPTVQTPSILYAQLAVPFSPAAHRLHLPHLPAPEAAQVPTKIGMNHRIMQDLLFFPLLLI